MPFEATGKDPWLRGGRLAYGCNGTTAWERDFGVARNGDIYVKAQGAVYHGLHAVHVYDTATFKKVTMRLKNGSSGTQATLGWAPLGPGQYFTKSVEIKPNSDFTEYTFDLSGEANWKGVLYRLNLSPTDAATGSFQIDWVRLGEGEGATAWNFNAEDAPELRLPATMRKEKLVASRQQPVELQGALWWKPGFSPMGSGALGQCQCTGSDFDVDDFGRVFAPDTGRFRVGVLDANGNEITSIGAYGNQDCCGPDSYVMDPAGKFLRPRQADDPKDLVSPFAKPEIAFGWIVGVAVTDRHAYVDDVLNKRLLRLKGRWTK